nr:MAG TPA: hypothetical protein [Caudoviricetes sp.]
MFLVFLNFPFSSPLLFYHEMTKQTICLKNS